MTAATPQPNGRCGCGAAVGPGKFFAPAHDRWAEAFIVRSRYGTIAAFLEHHGYGPGGKNARQEAEGAASPGPAGEEAEDLADVAEAERRLSDPAEVPIPYEQARKSLRLP